MSRTRFLIVTILVITYLVGITNVLLESRRGEYYDPVPETENLTYVCNNTVDAIKQILSKSSKP